MAAEGGLRPRIVLISLYLGREPYFDDTYVSLLTKLGEKARLQRAEMEDSAVRLSSQQPPPSAILITDEAPTHKENARVWETVLRYVRQGGTAVIMGHFPCFVEPLLVKPFFAKAGLCWEAGSYHRATFVVNRDAVSNHLATKLPPQYSPEAVSLKNVPPAYAWYRTNEDSVIESDVFAPTSANIPNETPVAFTNIGDGKLGYVGDVNGEEGSDAVVLAMCGL